jgi:hypothetical protein
METEKEWREKEGSKISKHKTETELHTLLSFGRGAVISMEKELFNPDVFNEVKYGEKEGIGIYYPIYRDGSCAEAQYIKLVILERASKEEMQEYDKERLGHLLRR